MKTVKFTAAIFMLALVSSCSKTEEMTDLEAVAPNVDGEIYVINATSDGSATRTALGGEDGLDILWQEGDAMNLYVKDVTYDNGTYTISANDTKTGTKLSTKDSGATTAEFATEDSSAIPTVDDATGTVTYFALTPYQDNKLNGAAEAGGSEIKLQNVSSTNYVAIYFLMPATQKYVADSYDPSVAFAYAKTDDISSGLSFDNLFGVLRLNLIGAVDQYVTSITVTAASGNLSGYVNAYTAADMVSNESLKLSAGGTGTAATITMDCSDENAGEGVALSGTATPFNIALLPVISDLTVAITYKVDGVETTKSYTTSADITRSGLTNMNDLDITPSATQSGGTESLTQTDSGDLTEA